MYLKPSIFTHLINFKSISDQDNAGFGLIDEFGYVSLTTSAVAVTKPSPSLSHVNRHGYEEKIFSDSNVHIWYITMVLRAVRVLHTHLALHRKRNRSSS
jgi:hypothetical protein